MGEAKKIVNPVSVDPLREKFEQLIDRKILEHKEKIQKSEGGYWDKISKLQIEYNLKKWRVIRSYDNGGGENSENCELCGHHGCRYMYVISDGVDQLTIGSECVTNYTVDKGAKEVIRNFQSKVVKKQAKVEEYRDLLVRMGMWMSKNGTRDILTSIAGSMFDGKDITFPQRRAVESIISKDPPKVTTKELSSKEKRILEIIEKTKGKSMNSWEAEAIPDIIRKFRNGYDLSDKQISSLERLANR